MIKKFRKGSNSGMPILAVVAVMCSLAGIGVIYQVVGSVGSETGWDHDRSELVDLGSSVENKCSDLTGTSDTTSITPITVETEVRSDASIRGGGDGAKLILDGQERTDYDLPDDECDITIDFEDDSIGAGTHQIEVSGETSGGEPEITVTEVE